MTASWMLPLVLLAWAGTWLIRRYALRSNLVDLPGERRSHRVPTPRGGGLAIVICMLLALLALAVAQPLHLPELALAAAGLALVAGIGWWDDHRPLSPLLRLCVHVVGAGLLGLALFRYSGDPWAAAIAFFGGVVLVNVWNFIDGIDGLAATQGLIAALGFVLLSGDPALHWLGLAFIAALSGFLPWNFPKARIFLGDAGSGGMGYVLAGLWALSATGLPMAGQLLPLLCLGVCLVDASFTLLSRMLRGERWWTPHVQHAYQRLGRRAGSHVPVTLGLAMLGLLNLGWMLLSRNLNDSFMIVASLSMLCLLSGLWLVERVRQTVENDRQESRE